MPFVKIFCFATLCYITAPFQVAITAEELVETVETVKNSAVDLVIVARVLSDTSPEQPTNHTNNKTLAGHEHDDHSGHGHHTRTLLYPFTLLLVGCVFALLPSKVPIPYTVLIFMFGVMSGVITTIFSQICVDGQPKEKRNCESQSQRYGQALAESATLAVDIDAHFMLHVFLPILIFESASAIDWHVFKRVMWNAVILAVPGLLLSTALTAVWLLFCQFGTEDSWQDSQSSLYMAFLFGAVLSATDPVAVVAILKDVGAEKSLSVSVEAESLLNDGVAVVVFLCLEKPIYFDDYLAPAEVVRSFMQMSIGGLAWGATCGVLMSWWLDLAYDMPMVELTITVFVAYFCFFVAELPSFHVSGVLANVGLGLCFSAYGRFKISPAVLHDLHGMWELLAFTGNTLIFGLSGLIIGNFVVLRSEFFKDPYFWANQVLLYVALNVIRLGVVALAYPLLRVTAVDGYKLNWKGCVVSVWGALRGAVGLALAMIVKGHANSGKLVCKNNETRSDIFQKYGCEQRDGSNTTRFEDFETFSDHMVVTVCIVVLLTLLINSTTMKPLIKRLKINNVSEERALMFDRAMEQLDKASLKKIQLLKKDPSLHCVDWSLVKNKRFLPPVLRNRRDNSRRIHISENMHLALVRSKRRSMHRNKHIRREARRRFLVAVRASYQKQFKKALLSGTGFRVLMDALDAAFDQGCNFSIEWDTICDSTAFLAVDEMVARTGLVNQANHATGLVYKSKMDKWCDCLKFFWKRKIGLSILYFYLRFRDVKCITWYLTRRILREIQHACDRASAYLLAREEACEVLSKIAESEADVAFYRSMAENGIKLAVDALTHCYRLFPEVTVSVETHRALLVVLTMQKLETHKLKNCGVLDEDEAANVTKAINRNIKNNRNKHRFCPNLRMPEKASTLREVPWLADVSDDIFNTVFTNSLSSVYKINDIILCTGEVPRCIYVVASGTISLTFGNREQEFLQYDDDASWPGQGYRRRVMSTITDEKHASGLDFSSPEEKEKENESARMAKQTVRRSTGAAGVNVHGVINMRVADTVLLQSQIPSPKAPSSKRSLFSKKQSAELDEDQNNSTQQRPLKHKFSRGDSAWDISHSSSARDKTVTTDAHKFRRPSEDASSLANDEDNSSMMTVTDSNINTYETGQTILDIVAGQTVGALAWIQDKDYASPFELRATSTSVEVYSIPISLIRESPKLRDALMTCAGRTIAFQVFTNNNHPSPFWHWTERSLKKHLTTWKVTRPGAYIEHKKHSEDASNASVSMEQSPSNESLGISEAERELQPLMCSSESKQQHVTRSGERIDAGVVADTNHEWFLCNFIQHLALVRGDIIKVEVGDSSYAASLSPSYSREHMQELISEDTANAARTGHRTVELCSAPMPLVPSAEAVAHLDDQSVVYYIHVDAWLCMPDRAEFHLVDNMEDLKLEWEELTGVNLSHEVRNLLAGHTQDVKKTQRILKIWHRSISATEAPRKRADSLAKTPASPETDSVKPPTPLPTLVLAEDAAASDQDPEAPTPVTAINMMPSGGDSEDQDIVYRFPSVQQDPMLLKKRVASPLPGQLSDM